MSKNKNIMESSTSGVLKMIQLTESNIEKAEIVLAVKGEIVDKLQRQSEVINNMGVDVLGPLLDRIKAEHGLEAADAFRDNISGLLTHAVTTLMDVKDKISTETLKLTGDITSEPGISELDNVEDVAADVDSFDMEAAADFGDEIAVDDDIEADAEIAATAPLERAMKESHKRVGVQIQSKKGTVGNKFFESKEEMKSWLALNESKIAKVIKILK